MDFFYEYTDTKEINENTKFFRTYGLEHWVFDNDSGLMKSRMMSGNTIEIKADERWFHDLESINVRTHGPWTSRACVPLAEVACLAGCRDPQRSHLAERVTPHREVLLS